MVKKVFLASLGLLVVSTILALNDEYNSLWGDLVNLSVWGILGSAVAVFGDAWQKSQNKKFEEQDARKIERQNLLDRVEQIDGIDNTERQEILQRIERLGGRESDAD